MTSHCNLSMYVSMALVTLAYSLWAPWAVWEQRAPSWIRVVAWVLVVAGVAASVVWMPVACAEMGV
jgi:hypothetical protein